MATMLKAAAKPVPVAENNREWDGMLTGVYTLWLKHMRKFVSSKLEIMATLYLPLLWMLLFGVCMESMIKSFGSKSGSLGYKDFITPGVMLLTGLTATVLGGSTLLMERLNGIIKEYLVAPVPRLAVLLGTLGSGLTKALLQVSVVLLVGMLFDSALLLQPLRLLAGLLVIVLFSAGFVGISAGVACQSNGIEEYHALILILNMPLLFLSNALYPLEVMPRIIQIAAYFNPTTYAADALRHLLYGTRLELGLQIDLPVLSLFMLFGLWYGYRHFQRTTMV
ncbi:MAG TPA: ABC transporter permease [Chloroflexia bacterium]|nr:ABC transporter permease [Chloroflexia bacterium]